jgi:hypothetical protein
MKNSSYNNKTRMRSELLMESGASIEMCHETNAIWKDKN